MAVSQDSSKFRRHSKRKALSTDDITEALRMRNAAVSNCTTARRYGTDASLWLRLRPSVMAVSLRRLPSQTIFVSCTHSFCICEPAQGWLVLWLEVWKCKSCYGSWLQLKLRILHVPRPPKEPMMPAAGVRLCGWQQTQRSKIPEGGRAL